MKLKKLPSQCIAPLRLTEITLHGIGSYFKPARLEIKPLTILCGTNGAGKSTWIKVLSALKEALTYCDGSMRQEEEGNYRDRCVGGVYPHLAIDNNGRQEEGRNYLSRLGDVFARRNLLNIRLLDKTVDKHGAQRRQCVDSGGSFSLTLKCIKRLGLKPLDNWRASTGDSDVLSTDGLTRGDIVKLRFTVTPVWKSHEYFFVLAARFSINGKYAELRTVRKNIEDMGKSYEVIETIFCQGDESEESGTACCDENESDLRLSHLEDELSFRIEQVVRSFIEGVFSLSAIRNIAESHGRGIENEENYKRTVEEIGGTRYVGRNGEHSHVFRRYFSVTPVFDPRKNLSYIATKPIGVRADVMTNQIWKDVLEEINTYETHRRNRENGISGMRVSFCRPGGSYECLAKIFSRSYFWQYLMDFHKTEVLSFYENVKHMPTTEEARPEVNAFLFGLNAMLNVGQNSTNCEISSPVHWDSQIQPPRTPEMAFLLHPLYELLRDGLFKRNDFFRWFLRQFDTGQIAFDDTDHLRAPRSLAWARFLASLPETELSNDDVETLNEWALQEYLHLTWSGQRIGLRCDSLFNWWSHELLGVDSMAASYGMRLRDYTLNRPSPVGYLSSFVPSEDDDSEYVQTPYTNKLLSEESKVCGGEEPSFIPGYFSAGFHQVVPILVQMNMMRMNEILAVENPEVHLHPGLQLSFMEFFVKNALIGKYSLIETHSDLMIRRVLRAIAEEEIRQSWVSIAFVDTEKVNEENNVWTSKIEPLNMDNRGCISNWPKGFLDDDERETQALMRAMYGDRFSDMEADYE
jgi:hypothetical protein